MRSATARDTLGDLLLVMGSVTQEQILEALAKQRGGDARPLGALLVELGYATSQDVECALMRQRARRGHMSHADGVRLLEEAEQSTKRAAGSMEELAQVVEELVSKAK